MSGLVGYLVLFVLVGVGFVFVHLMIGKMIRPAKPDPDKLTIYECGEPTIGSAWVQFDLRFYVIALLFVVFDVEVAFFFPWAVVFGQANALAKPNGAMNERQIVLAEGELLATSAEPGLTEAQQEAAGRYAWLAFFDILVFFGVLLVGFAYLWSRGDLKWVRSLAAEEGGPSPTPAPPNGAAKPGERVLAGTGS
jgi:NADH-quinone oxidoreductase subunit A